MNLNKILLGNLLPLFTLQKKAVKDFSHIKTKTDIKYPPHQMFFNLNICT